MCLLTLLLHEKKKTKMVLDLLGPFHFMMQKLTAFINCYSLNNIINNKMSFIKPNYK